MLADAPLRLDFPRNFRQLLDAFAVFPHALSEANCADLFRFEGVSPRDIYATLLSRMPETIALANDTSDNAAVRFWAVLTSDEFRHRVLQHFLAAHTELPRDVFIHIPKCAGTDLIINLAQQRMSLPVVLGEPAWLEQDDFLRIFVNLARRALFSERIFVCGHIHLEDYIKSAGVRREDRIFTIVRDPTDLFISQANYAVGRLRQDPTGRDPDTATTLSQLGLAKLPDDIAISDLKRLTLKALLDERISGRNTMCQYLGKGRKPRCEDAVTNLVTHDVEVTSTRQYNRWRQDRWGLETGSRHNTSSTLLTKQEVLRHIGPYVRDAVSEDQKLFDIVAASLERAGASSITGTAMAAHAGPDGLFGSTGGSRHGSKLARDQVDGDAFTVIEGFGKIATYVAALPPFTHAAFTPANVIVDLGFGTDTPDRPKLGDGWARPEPRFNWTNGISASLTLVRPHDPGHLIMRVQGAPFVAGAAHPHQRLTILVNGDVMGTAIISDVCVIEFALTHATLGDGADIRVEFRLPDARRPSELKDTGDTRQLGFALSRLQVLCVESPVAVRELSAPGNVEALTPFASKHSVPTEAVALSTKELMLNFESIGENCEFGLVQRRCDAEPLGLLRFASAPYDKLMNALDAKFEGFGSSDNIAVELSSNGREYMVADRQFGLLSHAWVNADEKTPEEVHAREIRRLPFLREKLIDDLRSGSKVFVYHGMSPLSEREAIAMARSIASYGPSILLWVELANSEHPSGTVERLSPNLLKGYMKRFAPGEDAHDFDVDCWVDICRAASGFEHGAMPLSVGA